MELFEKNRRGLYIYFKNHKDISKLEKYGNFISISKKAKYVYIYLDEKRLPQVMKELENKKYVRKLVVSKLVELETNFERIEKDFTLPEGYEKESL